MRPSDEKALQNLESLTRQYRIMASLANFPLKPFEVKGTQFPQAQEAARGILDDLAKKIEVLEPSLVRSREQLIDASKQVPMLQSLFRSLVQQQARLAGVFSDLGPEGIQETQQLSAISHGLAARTRGLRKMLDQGAEPVFRRLSKSSGYLESARKALREALAAAKAMTTVWKTYTAAEGEFLKQLSRQSPEQYRVYMQVQRGEGA